MSAYYGNLGDHWGSIAFLFGGYGSIVLWMKWTSRRPRVTEPPVGPRGRRAVDLSERPERACRVVPTYREAKPPAPFDWNQ